MFNYRKPPPEGRLIGLLGLAVLAAACFDLGPATDDSSASSDAPDQEVVGTRPADDAALESRPSFDDSDRAAANTVELTSTNSPRQGDAESCVPHRTPVVSSAWHGKLASGEEADLETPHLEWLVMNETTEPLTASLTVTLDRGSLRTDHIALGKLELRPGEEKVVTVDLQEHADDLEKLRFSGMAMLTTQSEAPRFTVVSKPRFFHPTASGFRVYDEETMADRYHHGDFRGLVQDDPEPGVVTTRIVSAADVIRTNTDDLEPEVRADEVTP